ncbi:hypothetical protein OU798_21220 [Prolixibacteraceae bacterium Z1-6]|uniref:Long-chain fatty acid transport protein n=1 Tax=Draconibacterium aestuarii TaxID=2998507 RepID=A0A9X3F981_9BACT|nr:hypothetical protein [Prolixibacteraceae bacterium Z1-6]
MIKQTKINTRYFILCVLLFAGGITLGQNTVSPYSIFGPGEIQSKGFGTNTGMGGAGIAMESGNYLNNLNPASYAGMDSLRLIVEFGLQGKSYSLNTSRNSHSGFTGNLAYLAIGFKYTPWLAGSFGVVPFSSIGYSIDRVNYVEGIYHQYTSNYVGSGGISQLYYSNAARLGKHLSLGATVSYMFGSLIQEENLVATTIVPSIMLVRTDYMRSMYVDFGVQYKFKTDKRDYSLGLTFALGQSLNSRHSVSLYNSSGTLMQSDDYNTDYLAVPNIIGTGLGIKADKYTFALDYTFQNWSGIRYPIQNDGFVDSHKFTMGIELNPWEKRAVNVFYKNWSYRFGMNYESSYLTFGNSNIKDRSFTLGFGIHLYDGLSKLDLSVTGGMKGTQSNNLLQEKYILFNVGFSLNEMAFIKRKIN